MRKGKWLIVVTMILLLIATSACSALAADPSVIYATYNNETVMFDYNELITAYGEDNTNYKSVWLAATKNSLTVDGKNIGFPNLIEAIGIGSVTTMQQYAALANAVEVSLPATVRIVAADGSIGNVEANPNIIVASNDATLSNLTVAGTTVTGFAAGTLNYNVELAAGTTTVPTVVATVTDTGKANAVVTPAASLPGLTTVLVTAENGTTTKTYTINFTVAAPAEVKVEDLGTTGYDIEASYVQFGADYVLTLQLSALQTKFTGVTKDSVVKATINGQLYTIPVNPYNDTQFVGEISYVALGVDTTNSTSIEQGKTLIKQGVITIIVPANKEVAAVTAIPDKNVAYATAVGDVGLPTQVEVTLDDNSKVNLAVAWDTSAYDGNVAGEYTLQGTLTLVAGTANTANHKASVKVIVAAAPPAEVKVEDLGTTGYDIEASYVQFGADYVLTLQLAALQTKFTGVTKDSAVKATINGQLYTIPVNPYNDTQFVGEISYLALGVDTTNSTSIEQGKTLIKQGVITII
jgi:hypothetical protein